MKCTNSASGFWSITSKYAKKLGAEVLHKTICLWIVIKKGDTPIGAKSIATAALG